jgi:YD repeat-containing protein
MLGQSAQTTTLRRSAINVDTYLNSKVQTWWQPDPKTGSFSHRWLRGGDFVWSGLSPSGSPRPFPDWNWNPDSILTKGLQAYQLSDGWIFGGAITSYDPFSHALEAVDGDGVYSASHYGYPYGNDGSNLLPPGTGMLPIAKFVNAKRSETLYWNFEGKRSEYATGGGDGVIVRSSNDDPLLCLQVAHTGRGAWSGPLSIRIPDGTSATTTAGISYHELRYFVLASSASVARASAGALPDLNAGNSQDLAVVQVSPAEKGSSSSSQWWMVRLKVKSGLMVSLAGVLDDVAAFPWRRMGAPASVSHYTYDRTLGLVTSITGSNGRTTRYRYDKLGRLMTVYDAYGKSSSSTQYGFPAALYANQPR